MKSGRCLSTDTLKSLIHSEDAAGIVPVVVVSIFCEWTEVTLEDENHEKIFVIRRGRKEIKGTNSAINIKNQR